jgi:hypothetical protein
MYLSSLIFLGLRLEPGRCWAIIVTSSSKDFLCYRLRRRGNWVLEVTVLLYSNLAWMKWTRNAEISCMQTSCQSSRVQEWGNLASLMRPPNLYFCFRSGNMLARTGKKHDNATQGRAGEKWTIHWSIWFPSSYLSRIWRGGMFTIDIVSSTPEFLWWVSWSKQVFKASGEAARRETTGESIDLMSFAARMNGPLQPTILLVSCITLAPCSSIMRKSRASGTDVWGGRCHAVCVMTHQRRWGLARALGRCGS